MFSIRRASIAAAASVVLAGGLAPAVAGPGVVAQPGDAIKVGEVGCTLGFLFSGSDGARYMTTAGHCSVVRGQRRTWSPGQGPVVSLAGNADGSSGAQRIGTVVFAELVPSADGDDDYDISVIRLDKTAAATAKVRGLGAPSGINDSRTDARTVVSLSGEGTGVGAVKPTRDLVAKTLKRPEFVYADGPAAPGDSGAPVLDSDGAAIGTLLGAGGNSVTAGTAGPPAVGHDGSLIRIGRLRPVLGHAQKALRLTLRLQNR